MECGSQSETFPSRPSFDIPLDLQDQESDLGTTPISFQAPSNSTPSQVALLNLSNRIQWKLLHSGRGPKGRYGHTGVLVNHKFYIYGGGCETLSDEFVALDLQTWTWERLDDCVVGNIPSATAYHCASVRSLVYLLGYR